MRSPNKHEIIESMKKRPHLFILGAGATKATIPNGDKNGRQSPVMDNFLQEIGLSDLLKKVILKTQSNNIEAIYSELVENPKYIDVVTKIENGIVSHYQQMELPDSPTLYDYLILSLRKKDCIATFNWDPLLIQAYNRVNKITSDLPEMLFLHNCVEVGLCEDCRRFAPLHNKICPECGKEYKMPRLMFPTKNKDYSQDIFLQGQWKVLDYFLQNACIVTIWGYSAPDSDLDAKDVMLKAFSKTFRKLDQIEIADIADKNILVKKWEPFVQETNYHLNIHRSLLDTLLSEFPRRSIEEYTKRYIEGWWGNSRLTLKECTSFSMLRQLFEPLIVNEKNNNYNVI